MASKLTLKNIDLKINQGEFVCIVGDVASGKTSLLQAIIGDMMYVSDKTVEKMGGLKAEKTSKECFELHTTVLRTEIEKDQVPVL